MYPTMIHMSKQLQYLNICTYCPSSPIVDGGAQVPVDQKTFHLPFTVRNLIDENIPSADIPM